MTIQIFRVVAGLLAGLTAMLALAAWHSSLAHKGASGIVKERMDVMKDIGKRTKAIGLMVRGKTRFDAQKAKAAAQVIGDHAKHIPMMFPKGSIKGPSEALANIWEDWPEFQRLARDLERYAKELALENDLSKGRTAEFYKQIQSTCRGCHKDYRKKK